MKEVWKYTIDCSTYNRIDIDPLAKFLKAECNIDGLINLWFLVTPEANKQDMTITVKGTGHEIGEPNLKYLDTVFHPEGYVFHLFEDGI